MPQQDILIGGTLVKPGDRISLDLPMASLYSHAPMSLPLQVIHSKRDGPRLFVSAAIHGDEINGVEIIRRLLRLPMLKQLRGTLFAVPIVNVYGFINGSRYLPDRRDLNRAFPGSEKGSMAARLAELFLEEIVTRSDYGIDLHTG
ncbi:MAG: succinylglutamate desuccinylase/aspartoacylase family protein, partial [Gammaproteobacteria bacterium]